MAGTGAPETLVLDTSFLGHELKAQKRPDLYTHWPAADLDRIARAIRAISVVTVAEERAGYLLANWGERRIAERLQTLRAHLWLPLDDAIVVRWAELHAHCRRTGVVIGHNDLWITATAIVHALPLVTSDEQQAQVSGLTEAIHLPAP